MSFFDDVLDATGRTPRELGSVHLFIESCVRSDAGDSVLTIWVQAAFGKCTGEILCADQRWPIPTLEDGRVVRARLPLKLPVEITSVQISADCPVKDSSLRVRPAWKLTDTYAVTTSQTTSSGLGGGMGGALLLNVVTLPLGVAIIPRGVTAGATQTNIRVEKARSLPLLTCTVTAGASESLSAATWETVWSVGAPFPSTLVQTEAVPARWSEATPAQAPAVEAGESPWAFAQGLVSAGFPLERVRDRLVKEKGLTEGDATLLLADVQPSGPTANNSPEAEAADDVTTTGLNVGPILGLGSMFVSLVAVVALPTPFTLLGAVFGLVFGAYRVFFTFGAFRPRPTIDASRLLKLTTEDTATRCSRHSEFASLGACSRCGTFCCRVCAPFEGFPAREVCMACESLPAVQLDRLARARRVTAIACLTQLSLFVVTTAILAALAATGARLMTIFVAVGLGLAGAQFKQNSVWPGLLSLLLGFPLLILASYLLDGAKWSPAAFLLWPLWFAAAAVLLTMASTQRGQVRAVEASTKPA